MKKKGGMKKIHKKKIEKKNTFRLFDEYIKEIKLEEEEEKWYCAKCENFVNANRKFDFYSLPSILIISLNRFKNEKIGK